MDNIRSLAFVAAGRVFMVAVFAVGLLILAFAFEPVLALKAGGLCGLASALFLLHRSGRTDGSDRRIRELGLLVGAGRPASREDLHKLLAAAVADAYVQFARWASGIAILCFASALLLGAATR